MRDIRIAVISLALLGSAGHAVAQQAAPPAARAADVASMDAILGVLYDVISGPAGEARDWDRFHSLFIEGARLIPTGRAPDGTVRHNVQTPAEWVATSGRSIEENGFYEREIGRTTETFGNIAHVFSAYDSRRTADAEPYARGINSIQLLHDGERYWIVTIFWDSERPDNPISERHIGGG